MVRAGCVFAAGIHPSRTWTSGSFESVRWNACVHKLDLGLYSHPKEFWGNGVWTHVNSKGKIPSTGKMSPEDYRTRDTVAASPSTTNWAIPAPNCSLEPQDPSSTNYFSLRYFEGSERFSSILCLQLKIRYLRIKNQLITAQPYKDWGWNFDIFQ